MDDPEFMQSAYDVYRQANHAALVWQLDRMNAGNPWINTKFNSITLQDFENTDALHGPQFTYGWIQGRGLEALVMHARKFRTTDTELSVRLDGHAKLLYPLLCELYASHGGASFCYNADLQPVCTDSSLAGALQRRDPDISTYSDLFVTKGLIAAATRFAPEDVQQHLNTLSGIVTAIKQDRFLMSEIGPITEQALAEQASDYGPMMIAQGAASLLHQLDLGDHDTFSISFTDTIFSDYFHQPTRLLANTPNGDLCNVGHAIELAGFAFEILRRTGSDRGIDRLADLVVAAFRSGYNGTGLQLSVALPSLKPTNEICPWWSLPETIRAASLGYELTDRSDLLSIWRSSHAAFFEHYWRCDPPIAYQSMTSDGPIDYVPATPDLDPGYHTGLSLLAAIEMAERQMAASTPT